MDDNFVEHIRVGGQPHGLFFHILAVEFYFTVEISEVRNLHFGMDGILYLEENSPSAFVTVPVVLPGIEILTYSRLFCSFCLLRYH